MVSRDLSAPHMVTLVLLPVLEQVCAAASAVRLALASHVFG